MRMKGQHHILPVFQIFAHIFDLAGVHMGHGKLYRAGQIDDGFPVRRRLPYIQHRVAYFQGVFRLCPRKALRAVLKPVVSAGLLRQILQKFCTVHGDLENLLF